MTDLDDLPERFRPVAAWLRDFSASTRGVVATHVGGSLVNDRVDDLSDLDATVVTDEESARTVFDTLREALDRDWQVEHVWVLPTPTWHGGLQLFATLVRPDGPLIIDVVVDGPKPEWLAVDPRRHGRPLVLHDPQQRVEVREEPDDRLRDDALESATRIAERLPVARWLVVKAIHRGHWPEAFSYHLRFGVEALVQLLRTVHSPARWDFGLRYLDDLPDPVSERVVGLLPGDRDLLLGQVEEAFAWQQELLEELLPARS